MKSRFVTAGRSLTQSKEVIKEYEQTAGAKRIGKDTSHGIQPGDPDKAAELMILAAEDKDTPFRLLLGTDAVTFADHVMQGRIEEYAKWKKFSCQSDFCGSGSPAKKCQQEFLNSLETEAPGIKF